MAKLEGIRIKNFYKIIMFYYPNRDRAIKIQQALEAICTGMGGKYFFGDSAWEHIKSISNVDLHGLLQEMANQNAGA